MKQFKLSVEKLHKPYDYHSLNFTTTKELKGKTELVWQENVLAAIDMALHVKDKGYNVFAMGDNGMGKQMLILNFLKNQAKDKPVPKDWAYVYNFDAPDKPSRLCFEPGEARVFKKDMEKMISDLQILIKSAFEGQHYRAKVNKISNSIDEEQEALLSNLDRSAAQKKLSINKSDEGFMIVAINHKNKPFDEAEFEKMPQDEKIKIDASIKLIQSELEKILTSFPLLEKQKQKDIQDYNIKLVTKLVNPFLKKISTKWSAGSIQKNGNSSILLTEQDKPAPRNDILTYFKKVTTYILANYSIFLHNTVSARNEKIPESKEYLLANLMVGKQIQYFNVNIVVDQTSNLQAKSGAPVIFLDNPNYARLFGKIEYVSQFGGVVTDYNLIKPGALHLANGGYLVMNAKKILELPGLWETLKYAIKNQNIQFLSLENESYQGSLASLDPEEIPLDIKIILIGEAELYYQLWNYDNEFQELFKIVADFDNVVPLNHANALMYTEIVTYFVRKEKLRPLDKFAIAHLIEIGGKIAGSQEFITANISQILNIVREANYLANKLNLKIIGAVEIRESFRLQKHRKGRISNYMQQNIKEKIIIINTQGKAVGEINGLSILTINDFMYGQPQRISCSVYNGKNGIIDIERSVHLSGSIHSKGVMITQGFLNSRFGETAEFSFSATLVFEQSYGEIDGDSATCAETLVLLSALSKVPLKQGLAITGSMDQKGNVQAIGGVNQKIEGFFEICKQGGLDGNHGVVIPKSNMKDLMLSPELREAVGKELFAIYAINHIDEALEIFTGKTAGKLDDKGYYPDDSVNFIIGQKWLIKPGSKDEFPKVN
ncbi:ATP-binding protein [Candidatus Hepatincolaceae symbiont of Richtersius coronifer]